MIDYDILEKNMREVVVPEFISRSAGRNPVYTYEMNMFSDSPNVWWRNFQYYVSVSFSAKRKDTNITQFSAEVKDLTDRFTVKVENINLVFPIALLIKCSIYEENGKIHSSTTDYWNVTYKNCLLSDVSAFVPKFTTLENCEVLS